MPTPAHDRRPHRALLGIDALLRDLRFAARTLRRSPGSAATVILISAIGIGGVAVMFSVLC